MSTLTITEKLSPSITSPSPSKVEVLSLSRASWSQSPTAKQLNPMRVPQKPKARMQDLQESSTPPVTTVMPATETTPLEKAIFKLIPEDEQKKLPEDENTPEKRANKLWAYFDKKDNERLAEGEFIKGVIENENAMRLIQYEPPKQ